MLGTLGIIVGSVVVLGLIYVEIKLFKLRR